MPQHATNQNRRLVPGKKRLFAVLLPQSLIDRLHLDAVRRRMTMRTLVANMLDERLPRSIRIVSDADGDGLSRKRASA